MEEKKTETRTFTCDLCKKTFETDRPQAEAIDEAKRRFGLDPTKQQHMVACTECYTSGPFAEMMRREKELRTYAAAMLSDLHASGLDADQQIAAVAVCLAGMCLSRRYSLKTALGRFGQSYESMKDELGLGPEELTK